MNYSFVEPLPPSQTHHIIWNVLLADKQMTLTPDAIENDKICHIVAILPTRNDFLTLNSLIPNIPFTVLDYGSAHTTHIDKNAFNQVGELVDTIARQSNGNRRNVLVFCNNGYQRSIPFLVYYLITFHPDEFPSIEKAVTLLLSQVDRTNCSKLLEPMIESVKTLLEQTVEQ
jgi:hypothetical protein